MQVLNFSKARAGLKKAMEDVCRLHKPTIITSQRGEPVVLMSLEDYNRITETDYLLASKANAKRLRSSIDHNKAEAFAMEMSLDEWFKEKEQ